VRVAVAIAGALLTGCSHTAVLLEADHVSHASQHAPFTREPTDYGYESLNAGLRWRPVQGLTVDALEGAVLNRHYCDTNSYGAMVGPREVFTARVTYEIQVRP